MSKRPRDEEREQRIETEIIVDAYGPEEQALGWCVFRRNRTPVSAEGEHAFRLKSNTLFDAEQGSEPAAPVEAMSAWLMEFEC